MQTPLAWLRRKPGCSPFTFSNLLIIDAGVRVCGVSQPPAYANKPTIPASTVPIAAKRIMRLAFGNSARGVRFDSGEFISRAMQYELVFEFSYPEILLRLIVCWVFLTKTAKGQFVRKLKL